MYIKYVIYAFSTGVLPGNQRQIIKMSDRVRKCLFHFNFQFKPFRVRHPHVFYGQYEG